MFKPVKFSTYKMLQKLSLNDFNRWVTSLYNSGLQDGIDAVSKDVVVEVTTERMKEILLSIRGIGEKRAQLFIDKLLEEDDGTETR